MARILSFSKAKKEKAIQDMEKNSTDSLRSRIICISGWKGSGKDTIANYLEMYYGYTKLSFAAMLKDMVSQTYSIPRAWFDDREFKDRALVEYPVISTDAFSEKIHSMLKAELTSGYWTPRALCILEGSIKRSVNSSFWIRRVMDVVRAIPTGKYVISDMRYKSEADTFRMLLDRQEYSLVRVDRFKEINTTDPSERDLDQYPFDAYITNQADLASLYSTIDWIMQYNFGIQKR